MSMFKSVIMPFELQMTTNNHPLIEKVQGGEHMECEECEKVLRSTDPEVTTETWAIANLFNNKMECLLLLIDLAQTRVCIFILLNKLETLATQLKGIECRLE